MKHHFAVRVELDYDDGEWRHSDPDEDTTREYTVELNRKNIMDTIREAIIDEYGKPVVTVEVVNTWNEE